MKSLRTAIQEGQYVRGDRIREEEVARSLGVSRTPVREALSRLHTGGLVEMASGGLVVAELSRSQIDELYAMREILEGSAARFAAQHASPSEIALTAPYRPSVRERIWGFRQARPDQPRTARAIYEACPQPLSDQNPERAARRACIAAQHDVHGLGRPELAVGEHARIIDAIEKRDADAAESVAREHIRRAQEARLAMMFNAG
jgi:DNA-binding GntR family transcriptional regulator